METNELFVRRPMYDFCKSKQVMRNRYLLKTAGFPMGIETKGKSEETTPQV